MNTKECVAGIIKAADGALSEDDLADLLQEIEGKARRRARENPGESARDQLLGIAGDLAREEEIKGIIERATRAKAVIAKRARNSFYEESQKRGAKKSESLNAVSVGNETGIDGAGRSAAAIGDGVGTELKGGLEAELRRSGMVKLLASRSREFDLDMAREIFRLNDGDAKPSGNGPAEATAKIIGKYQELARKYLNDAGAWIRKMPGWIVRQSHDPATILAKGYAYWRNRILPLTDERTFDHVGEDPGKREKFIRAFYDSVTTGVHNTSSADWLGGFKGPASRAKKVSQERIWHFKDADAWFNYNEEFGTGSVLEAVAQGLDTAARNVGLMRVWGPNPRAAFDADREQLIRAARDEGDEEEVKRLRNWTTEAFFKQIDGTANATGNPESARFHANIRAFMSWTKLGGVVVSAFSDVPIRASLLRHNGIRYLDGIGNGLHSLVEKRSDQDREAILTLVAAGADDMMGDIFSRHSIDASMSGKVAKINKLYFKLNIMRPWDNRMRGGIGAALSKDLAMNRAKSFDALHPSQKTDLRRYGIGKEEWDVLRQMDTTNHNNEHFMTADRLDDLDPEAFKGYVAPKIKEFLDRRNQALASREAAADKFEGRAKDWVDNRRQKLEAKAQKARDRFNEIRDAAVASGQKVSKELVDRMALMEKRFDLAKWDADLNSAVDRGTTFGAAQDAFKAGIKTGEERGKLVRDIQTIERRLEKNKAERVAKLDERGKTLADYISEKDREVSDFVDAIEAKKVSQRAAIEKAKTDTPEITAAQAEKLIKNARRDIKTSLNTYFADNVRKSVTRPGPREKALVSFGTSAGTPVGEAVRYLMQFKVFGIGFQTMHIMREFQRNGKLDKTGLAQLILGATALGYVSMQAKEMLKGRNPRDIESPADAAKVFGAAMAQGGGAGIYGDFLFGEANRFGGGLIATLGGPAVGNLEDIWQLKGKLQRFEDPSASAFQVAKGNIPFANVFWARLALDHMLFYKIQEALNPGFLRRMERRVEKENNQTFWLKPSSAVR